MRLRTFSRRMGRRSGLGNVIQSYKQIKQQAPASVGAGTRTDITFVNTVDNYTGPGAGNNEVPTGAVVKYVDIQLGFENLVNIASFVWISIQKVHSGQTVVDPRAAGGNAQRNQIYKQLLRCVGQNQNVNVPIRFKIPSKFQRCREGDKWIVTMESDTIRTEAGQIIYKFYR